MGGKQSAPAPPDYSAIATASTQAAQIQAKTSQDQLDWAKQQYNDIAPTTKAYMQSMTDNSDAQTANAAKDRERYETVYQPIEDQFNKEATGWNSADRANQEAGGAMADVSNQFDAQRKNALLSLESYGIDPSQTRFAALDLGTRVQQAATEAAAGTQSRRNTEATALALQGESINIGKGYPGQVAQSYAGATSAGSAGIASANNSFATGASAMGNPTAWGSLANSSNGVGISAMHQGFADATQAAQFNNDVASAPWKMAGQLVGAGISAAGMMMM